jgi:dihydrofolate reductase
MNHTAKIIAVAAITLDGKIAEYADQPSSWTSPEDKTVLRKLISQTDVILIGRTTYELHETRLTHRDCIVLTHGVHDTERKNSRLLLWNPSGASIESVTEPYRSISLLGGTQAYTYFLSRNLVDEMYLTLEPIIFGKGLSLAESRDFQARSFQLTSIEQLNKKGTLLLRYRKLPRSQS